MHKHYVPGIFFVTLILGIFVSQFIGAASPVVIISQIQTGDVLSARNEFVEIYNNSESDIEITGWCLYYASATSLENGSKMACFLTDNENLHLFLPAKTFAIAVSSQLADASPGFGSDLKFSSTLSNTAGHVRLIRDDASEVDKVGWGLAAKSAEGNNPAAAPVAGKVIQRKTVAADVFQDSNDNGLDFEQVVPKIVYSFGSIYEVQDVCPNINEIQAISPEGYTIDDAGNCAPPPVDLCGNIDGVQVLLAPNYKLDEYGDCVSTDECPNLSGIQTEVPEGYEKEADGGCKLVILPIRITELLPNAIGSDDGNEFIEIYNPNDSDVSLQNYLLIISPDVAHPYSFPMGSYVGPDQYASFSNDDIKFTLLNTTSGVSIVGIDDSIVDASSVYVNPDDGMAWALINNVWQYTNKPTPGLANEPSVIDVLEDDPIVADSDLAPCAANQYRNPLTNRCKLLPEYESDLAPCKDGQYRSEETNRCRSIASDVVDLVPCAEGQERNPATNRCRSITSVLGDATLVPCKEGQERNPDTNRCRNIVSMPTAAYAPEKTTQESNNITTWLVISGVGILAIGYGIWEWRHELHNLGKKLASFLRAKK